MQGSWVRDIQQISNRRAPKWDQEGPNETTRKAAPYNAGVGGSNPSPPTTKTLVGRLDNGDRPRTSLARPRTGRASSRFRSEPQLLHAISDVAVPIGEQMTVGPKGHAEIGVA